MDAAFLLGDVVFVDKCLSAEFDAFFLGDSSAFLGSLIDKVTLKLGESTENVVHQLADCAFRTDVVLQ